MIEAPHCAKAVQWYVEVFGFKEIFRESSQATGNEVQLIEHSELQLGKIDLWLRDQVPGGGGPAKVRSPVALGGTTSTMFVRCSDSDATVAKAVKEGATLLQAVAEQPWGARYGAFIDPFGFEWGIATFKGGDGAVDPDAPHATST